MTISYDDFVLSLTSACKKRQAPGCEVERWNACAIIWGAIVKEIKRKLLECVSISLRTPSSMSLALDISPEAVVMANMCNLWAQSMVLAAKSNPA